MNNIREKCLNQFWFLFIAYFIYWEPAYIKSQVNWLDKIFDGANFLILGLLIVFYIQRKKISQFIFVLSGMGIVLLGSTILHNMEIANIWKCLKYLWPILAVCLLTEMASEVNGLLMIKAQYAMCFVQVVINCFTVVFLPGGLYKGSDGERQFWLGNENVFIVTILAGLCTGALYLYLQGKKISIDYIIFCICSVLSVVVVWSAASLIGLFAFAAMMLISIWIKWDWPYKLKTAVGIWIAGFLSITIFRLQYLLKPLIVDILHKDLSLTERTLIWDEIIKRVEGSPIWGYGVETAEQFSSPIGGNPHWVHAHNYILELLVKGGMILLILFLLLLFVTSIKTDKKGMGSKEKILTISLLAFFITFIGDCYEMRTLFYMILSVAYCVDNLVKWKE